MGLPHHRTKGTLAPLHRDHPAGIDRAAPTEHRALLRATGVTQDERDFKKPLIESSYRNRIHSRDPIAIRHEGPTGAPVMQEILGPTGAIIGLGLDPKVGLITDGRFSGGSRGIAIGHVSPEAAAGGPIAALRDGDIVRIDSGARRMGVELTDEEIAARLAEATPPVRDLPGRWLRRYRALVTSANTGAILRDPDEYTVARMRSAVRAPA